MDMYNNWLSFIHVFQEGFNQKLILTSLYKLDWDWNDLQGDILLINADLIWSWDKIRPFKNPIQIPQILIYAHKSLGELGGLEDRILSGIGVVHMPAFDLKFWQNIFCMGS